LRAPQQTQNRSDEKTTTLQFICFFIDRKCGFLNFLGENQTQIKSYPEKGRKHRQFSIIVVILFLSKLGQWPKIIEQGLTACDQQQSSVDTAHHYFFDLIKLAIFPAPSFL